MSKQLSLYEKLSQGAGRDVWRDKAKTFRSTYKVPFKSIIVLAGWNVRTVFEGIEELAADLLANGQEEPLEGVMTPEGKFQLVHGERRYRAIELLRKQGTKWDEVEVIPVPKTLKPQDMVVRMLSSGIQKSMYKEIEIANGLLRLKTDFNLSNEEIGKRMGRSRQWADNMIKLAKQPAEIKQQVAEGKIKKTDVIIPQKEDIKEVAAGLTKAIPQPGVQSNVATENPNKQKFNKAEDIPPGGWREGEKENTATTVSGNDALKGVNFDKEVNEQEAQINIIAKEVNKIESLGKGLNEQSQKDLEKYLFVIRDNIGKLKEFYGKAKNKAVTV